MRSPQCSLVLGRCVFRHTWFIILHINVIDSSIMYKMIYTVFFNVRKLRHYPTWWRHQMETISAKLALCAGNSPVSGEFPSQRPVTRSFDVFFDLRLNKRLSKQSWGWWFETPSRPLWRQCNELHVLLRCCTFLICFQQSITHKTVISMLIMESGSILEQNLLFRNPSNLEQNLFVNQWSRIISLNNSISYRL